MILITGANGFIGKAVTEAILATGQSVVAAVRAVPRNLSVMHPNLQIQALGNFNNGINWSYALKGVHTVVHCAARAHVVNARAVEVLCEYREINIEGTLHLFRQSSESGVKRFIFISSIGVNGNLSLMPFNESSPSNPHNAYASAKLETEKILLDLAVQTGIEVVIIRPPLVYGPGAPGNFASLLRWLNLGLPLPFGAVNNNRSFVALENLVSLIVLCADRTSSPQAANQVFVVADGEDVSTSTLLRKVARAAGLPSRLLPVPSSWLRAGARLLGMREVADRLLGNLQVDATKARTLLGWQPVVTMDEQLAKMFEHKD